MSEYKQTSFSGGINLLLDDTRLPVAFKYKEGGTPYDITYNQYRIGLNVRTRFDVCTPVASSVTDTNAPAGVKQAIVSFGNYIIIFVAGNAYYRLNTDKLWTNIVGFGMSPVAPRYWTVAVPLTTTNYGRIAVGTTPTGSSSATADAAGGITQIQTNFVASTFGNIPGLLVQDGLNQPQFLYIDSNGDVQCRTTQTYAEWTYTIDPSTLVVSVDQREYVPVGTYMEWYDGVLFIVDTNYQYIYRSVSGRPLDFVINVDLNGNKGGDATTTSTSVGVSGITALKAMPGNVLFVGAGGNACFTLTFNTNASAPTIFGEYTFIVTPLFNANCVSERGIVNLLSDQVFIDANGLVSFSSAESQSNRGRNSVFSSAVQSLFTGIKQYSTQDSNTLNKGWSSAALFDNYAIFSVNTVLGYVLVVYDTINNVYSSIDTAQLGNHAAKQFATISTDTNAIYCITDDDRVVQLYAAATKDNATIRLGAVSEQDPNKEQKVQKVRAVMTNITQNVNVTCQLFVNNRLSGSSVQTLNYVPPGNTYSGVGLGPDINTQTNNLLFSLPDSQQGWKSFVVLSWTGGASLTAVSISTQDYTPLQALKTQAVTNQ
jgi:hypothetical protein